MNDDQANVVFSDEDEGCIVATDRSIRLNTLNT